VKARAGPLLRGPSRRERQGENTSRRTEEETHFTSSVSAKREEKARMKPVLRETKRTLYLKHDGSERCAGDEGYEGVPGIYLYFFGPQVCGSAGPGGIKNKKPRSSR